MESPWKILNLDPRSASEKEVKAAYAKLIKIHRPDVDPEGFQRVREAYEIGLAMVRERVASDTPNAPPVASDPETYTAPPAAALPAEPLPEALLEAERSVSRAKEAGDLEAVRKAVGALFYVCRSLNAGRSGIRMWQESLHRVSGGSSELVATAITASQLIAELEAGYSVLCHACLSHWESIREMGLIRQLGEGILAESKRVDPDETAVVALRIGLELGFSSPNTAMKLVNFAYPYLQREARDHYVPQVEQQIQLGRPFVGFREDQMEFWHGRFRRPQSELSWDDPPSEAALEYVSTMRSPIWEGYDLVAQLASPAWMARLQSVMRRKHGGLLGRLKPIKLGTAQPIQLNPQGARRRIPRPAWVVMIYGVIMLIRAINMGVSDEPVRPRTPVPNWEVATRLSPASVSSSFTQPFKPASPPSLNSGSMPWGDPLRRVEQARDQFNASLTGASALPSGAWSSLPQSSAAGSVASGADYTKGAEACAARVVELRRQARVTSWLNMLVTMHASNADPAWNAINAGDKERAFRHEVQSFFRSLANSDSTVETQVLELLLLDPSIPLLLKQETVFRQAAVLPVTTLIATWKLVSSAGPDQARLVATFASWYLDKHGNDIAVTTSERSELEVMVRYLPSRLLR